MIRPERKKEIKRAIVKEIKSLIFPVIMLLIILAGVYLVINIKPEEEIEEVVRPNGYEGGEDPIKLENDKLELVMDPLTTQFSLKVKKTGKVWYSNPVDADTDTVALGSEKAKIKSTLLMSYCVKSGLETSYNNYEYSIENGIYEVEPAKDYIRVKYSIGKVEKEYFIPPVITEKDYDEITVKMSKEGLNMVQRYYKKYDIKNAGKKDDVEALKASYPIYETEPIYVLRDKTTEALKSKMQDYFEEAGYTYEDYLADKELDQSETATDRAVFNVNVYYRLDGDDLVVEIPYRELEYSSSYPLYTLTPLPFFGAGGKEDEGFLLVPEGGGALIRFNNGKVAQNSYYANVYGWDMCLVRDSVIHNTRTYYNTFGISQGNDSFLCILEDGSSYASVQADISGHYNSYNFANAVYNVNFKEKFNINEGGGEENTSVYVFLPELPDESLVQRYHFINSGSYVDMAKEYQTYLKEHDKEAFVLNDDQEAPVVLDVISAVDKVKQVLGVPTSRPLKMTSFKDAERMMTELHSEGLNNLSVKLSGWMNGGVSQKMLDKVKIVRACGSQKDFQNLVDKANEMGIDLYLHGITQYANNSDIFDGFFSYRDAARYINKKRAELYQYSKITYAAREGGWGYYLLHPNVAMRMIDNLNEFAEKCGAHVSFNDLGVDLSADYYAKNIVSREQVKKMQTEKIANMSANGAKIMINMGNDYAALYSDMILDMDLRGSEYTILDEFVPFYQIALHGYKNYTGVAINLANNSETELLYSAEYGAGLQFTIMADSPFKLQKTLYTDYFGAYYDSWHEEIVSIYNRYNQELGHTFNQEITDHKVIEEGLKCTTYADGTKVYVNYNYDDKKVGSTVVPARNYVVVR